MPEFVVFDVQERGVAPRGLKKFQQKASRIAWIHVGRVFHETMRDKRFTWAHGLKAGYQQRTLRYTAAKIKRWGHARPLEWSGETRKNVGRARYVAYETEYGVYGPGRKGGGIKIFYPGAARLNFRPKGGTIRMRDEFTRLLRDEVTTLSREYEEVYIATWNADNRTAKYRI